MHKKYLVRLESGLAGHVIAETQPKHGRMATIFVDAEDGIRRHYIGPVDRVLASMPPSKREMMGIDQDRLGLDDDQLARLLKVRPEVLATWQSGRGSCPETILELLRVAIWLHHDHPALWRQWFSRIEAERCQVL
jgi:hypothetical protein